jgi:CubicO group peptidase (beta-lactamase class C family)
MKDHFISLVRLLEEGYEAGAYTAAAALVGLKGELLWRGAAGRLSRDGDSPLTTLDTAFDLASLTKPLATALAVLRLVEQGRLGLDTALGEVLPSAWLPADKAPLTLWSLLAHRAGLPAWRPFYQELLSAPADQRSSLLARLAAAEPLEYEPETATLYSDLGFMLLAAVAEAVSGESLDAFCRREIYRPLGLNGLGYRPLGCGVNQRPPIASTEPGLIPNRLPAGEVHDENAWAAGGVAGHAGLFGAGPEVFILVAQLFRSYQGVGGTAFPPDLVRRFFTPAAPGHRALGFDVPATEVASCSAGRYFSPKSVGHLGFTGTSFWLDLEQGQMVILLTNRVHMGRDNKTEISSFRPQFHEAASLALGFGKVFRN